MVRWTLVCAGLGLSVSSAAWAGPTRYDGHAVVAVDVPDAAWLQALTSAGAVVLDDRPGPGRVHLRVPPQAQAGLAASGLATQTLIADIQPGIDAERARLGVAGPVSLGASFFADFRDFAALDAHLDGLAADRPDIVQLVELGASLEGRPIRGVSIYGGSGEHPAVLLTGTMHAREWLSPMTVTCIADALAYGHDADAEITAALNEVEVILVPVLNPDGYVYSWEGDRYWRKNRRDGIGVDLNRNFPTAWGGEGSSGTPEDQNYRGTGPLSEPEAAALAQFILARTDLVAHVDYHTYGQLFLYPWGYTYEPTEDAEALFAVADAMTGAIAAVHGIQYTVLQGADLYPAAGVVDDWSYAEAGLFAFTPELRPSFDGPGDFVVDPAEIGPTCDENLAAALVLLDWAIDGLPDPPATTGDDSGGSQGSSSGDPGATSTGAAADSAAPGDTRGAAGEDGPVLETSATTDATGSETSVGGAAAQDDDSGCACSSPRRRGPGFALVWLGVVLAVCSRRGDRARRRY